MNRFIAPLLILSVTATSNALVSQDDPKATAVPAPLVTTDAYPLDVCVVTGRSLADGPIYRVVAEGRTFRVCTEGCRLVVKAVPQTYHAKLDQAVIAAQKPSYPLDTCAVSGKPLSTFEKPVELVLDSHLVIVGDEKFAAAASNQRAAIIERLVAATYRDQKPTYTRSTGVVSNAKLGTDAIDVVHGTTFVRLANRKSLELFEQNPARYLRDLGRGVAIGVIEPSGCCGACSAKNAVGTETAKTPPRTCCAAKTAAKTNAPKAGCCADKAAVKTEAPKAGSCCGAKAAVKTDAPKAGSCCAGKAVKGTDSGK